MENLEAPLLAPGLGAGRLGLLSCFLRLVPHGSRSAERGLGRAVVCWHAFIKRRAVVPWLESDPGTVNSCLHGEMLPELVSFSAVLAVRLPRAAQWFALDGCGRFCLQ